MKKFVILLLLGVFSWTSYVMASESSVMRPDIVITIKIKLHSKKSGCETGFGFCGIVFNISLEDNLSLGSEMVSAKATVSQNQLYLTFNEADLKSYQKGASMNYFQGKRTITLDEEYEVPLDVCKALGINKVISIKPGTYPLKYEQGSYTLAFPF